MFIGNDVVDLRDPEARPGAIHPRFPERVCADDELCAIYRAADPMRLLWAHWAAKESAFKAMRQLDPFVRFLPRRFRVELFPGCDGGTRYGLVRHAWHRAAVEIADCTDHLHAVARLLGPVSVAGGGRDTGRRGALTDDADSENDSTYFWQLTTRVRRFSPAPYATRAPSAFGRFLLIRAVAERLGCAEHEVMIERGNERGAPPRALVRGQRTPIQLTLSHHGRLVAYALAVPRLAVSGSDLEAVH